MWGKGVKRRKNERRRSRRLLLKLILLTHIKLLRPTETSVFTNQMFDWLNVTLLTSQTPVYQLPACFQYPA